MRLQEHDSLIITGASMGIGRALAVQLAERGVNLVLNARSEDKLEESSVLCTEAATAADKDVEIAVVPGNAAFTDIAEVMAATAAEFPNFKGFIHVAGVLRPGPLLYELSPADFDAVFEASVTGSHRVINAVVPKLLERSEGLAVFFGSGAADINQPGIAAYCAAKAAEERMASNLAEECSEITTLIWRPGIVKTRMQVQARESSGGGADRLQSVFRPWKDNDELLTPEESAAVLVDVLFDNPRQYHGRPLHIRELGMDRRK